MYSALESQLLGTLRNDDGYWNETLLLNLTLRDQKSFHDHSILITFPVSELAVRMVFKGNSVNERFTRQMHALSSKPYTVEPPVSDQPKC